MPDAVGVGQDLRVALVHTDAPIAVRAGGGLQRGPVNLVVDFGAAAPQDHPQRSRGRHRRVQRDLDGRPGQQAGDGQPHVAALGEGERPHVVGADDDLVRDVAVPAPPMFPHQPRQVPIARPLAGFQRREQALPLGRAGGALADRPPGVHLRGVAAGADIADRVAEGFFPRVRENPELRVTFCHPPIPDLPVAQASAGDRPVPLPHLRTDPAQARGLPGERSKLPPIQVAGIRDPGYLHGALPDSSSLSVFSYPRSPDRRPANVCTIASRSSTSSCRGDSVSWFATMISQPFRAATCSR